MPEASRTDAPLKNPQYPQGAEPEVVNTELNNFQRAPATKSSPRAIYGQLPPTRAESFGRTIGSAVGGVLRFPQRVGHATSRLRRAGTTTRAEASAAMLDMMDTAALRAENISRNTTETLSDWAHSARLRTVQLEEQAAARWQDLRSAARSRLDLAGRRARSQWNQTQRSVYRMQEEDPARFLIVVAGTAFVIGATLRIWRSNSNG